MEFIMNKVQLAQHAVAHNWTSLVVFIRNVSDVANHLDQLLLGAFVEQPKVQILGGNLFHSMSLNTASVIFLLSMFLNSFSVNSRASERSFKTRIASCL
jgi:hypothetical protein